MNNISGYNKQELVVCNECDVVMDYQFEYEHYQCKSCSKVFDGDVWDNDDCRIESVNILKSYPKISKGTMLLVWDDWDSSMYLDPRGKKIDYFRSFRNGKVVCDSNTWDYYKIIDRDIVDPMVSK